MKTTISIIIVTFNSSHRLKVLFDSFEYLPFDDYRFDLVIVDNNSEDVEETEILFNKVKAHGFIGDTFIKLAENYYWSFATNVGVEYALGEYVMLVNPDCVFKYGSFDNLFKMLDEYGIVNPKMVNRDGSISLAGGGIDRKNDPLYFNIGEGELDEGQYDITRSTNWCTGACMLFNKDIHTELDGFKEHGEYHHYNSDRDFCLRAVEKGYKCGIGGKETEIIHLIGKSCKGVRN